MQTKILYIYYYTIKNITSTAFHMYEIELYLAW